MARYRDDGEVQIDNSTNGRFRIAFQWLIEIVAFNVGTLLGTNICPHCLADIRELECGPVDQHLLRSLIPDAEDEVMRPDFIKDIGDLGEIVNGKISSRDGITTLVQEILGGVEDEPIGGFNCWIQLSPVQAEEHVDIGIYTKTPKS